MAAAVCERARVAFLTQARFQHSSAVCMVAYVSPMLTCTEWPQQNTHCVRYVRLNSTRQLLRAERGRHADHAVAGDQPRQLLLTPAIGASGARRDDNVTVLHCQQQRQQQAQQHAGVKSTSIHAAVHACVLHAFAHVLLQRVDQRNAPHAHRRSAVESCTRMAVPGGTCVPNSASRPRGLRTARARYDLHVHMSARRASGVLLACSKTQTQLSTSANASARGRVRHPMAHLLRYQGGDMPSTEMG